MYPPLKFLDVYEEEHKQWVYSNLRDDFNLLERRIWVITGYADYLGKCFEGKYGSRSYDKLTWDGLKEQSDEVVKEWIALFMIWQAVENVQAVRLNVLHGYLSVAIAALRNVIEASRWANAASNSAVVAREWIDNADKLDVDRLKKQEGFVFAPQIVEMNEIYKKCHGGGAHPGRAARMISVASKEQTRRESGSEKSKESIQLYMREINLVLAKLLSLIESMFPLGEDADPLLRQGLNDFKNP